MTPPAAQDTLRGPIRWAGVGMPALDIGRYRFKNSRHRHEHGDPLPADRFADRSRVKFVHEDNRSPEDRRDEQTHRLAEHMAEWHGLKKPDGLEGPSPAPVAGDLFGDRRQVGADVAVPVYDAFRVRRCSRRVEQLHYLGWIGRVRAEFLGSR